MKKTYFETFAQFELPNLTNQIYTIWNQVQRKDCFHFLVNLHCNDNLYCWACMADYTDEKNVRKIQRIHHSKLHSSSVHSIWHRFVQKIFIVNCQFSLEIYVIKFCPRCISSSSKREKFDDINLLWKMTVDCLKKFFKVKVQSVFWFDEF